MAGEKNLQHYENAPGETLTLSEVSEKIKDGYPIIARVVPKEYEIPISQELPGDSEVVLEKPRWLQFVLIRILDFFDEDAVKKEKGENFVNERKEYVGKEYMIPVCYQGTFKLINKPGRLSRYVSVGQIIKDLPRFIKLSQEIEYSPPENPNATSTIPADTNLEVKNVQIIEKARYIKCKSSGKTFRFKEDFPINCSAVDDLDEHTLLNLAGKFILLPKYAQLENVWPDDVVLKDDEEASTLLTLLGGPIRILKSFIKRRVYIVWMEREGTRHQTVGLVSRKIWNTQIIELKTFRDEVSKQKYIQEHFGENLDSDFAVNGLYMIKPVETDVVWLIAPTKVKVGEKPEDDKVIEKKLADYENVIRLGESMELADSGKETDGEDDIEDYEKPSPLTPPVYTAPPPPPPPVPLRRTVSEPPPVLLPLRPRKEDDIWKKIMEKARLGFDRVHEQLLRRVRQMEQKAKIYARSNSELGATRKSEVVKENLSVDKLSQNNEDTKETRLSRAYEENKDRPLPPLPPKSINVTDDDKLVVYDEVEERGPVYKEKNEDRLKANKASTLLHYPNLHKIGKSEQTSEDFYCYTVEELVECLKMCKLDQFAVICDENKLDGRFFRNFELNQLQSEPFDLSKIDVIKVKKIIEEGWRPKTEYGQMP